MTNDSLMPMDDARTTRKQVTIDPNQPLILSVTNSSGDISITASDRPDVQVIAERTDSKRNDDDARIEVVVDGNKISVHPNWQLGSSLGELAKKVKHQLKDGFNSEEWDLKKMKFGMNAHFDIRVELPRAIADGSTVSVKSASGDIRAADISARVTVATANGDIQLDRLNGRVSTHSASGNITLGTINGSIEANTANGDIRVNGGEAWTALRAVNGDVRVSNLIMKNARVTTVSGDVSADVTMSNKGTYTFDTVSGDVTLNTTLPPTGASLNFKAVSGDPKVSGDWTAASGKRSWQLAAGADGPEIRVKAVSGDMKATATTDPTVTMTSDSMPNATAKAQETDTPDSTQTDFDWDKAKEWASSITQKISQVVNEMDTAGDRRRSSDQTSATASTAPIPPMSPIPPASPASPPEHESHVGHHVNDSPTEPVDVTPFSTNTEPIDAQPFPANTEPIPSPEAIAPSPADVPETTGQLRLRLLEAVQRGEMTVDEALAQLDGDESTTSDQ